jgi:hypothetical protein
MVTQISSKFKGAILPSENLTQLLDKLRAWAPRIESAPLTHFEKSIVRWAVDGI